MALCTQGPQDMEVIVLDNHRTDVAQEQAQQGQLDFRRGHLPVTKEDNVLQRQEASQADMVAEGCKLGRVRRAIPSTDRKSTRLNSSHVRISYAVFCLKKKK